YTQDPDSIDPSWRYFFDGIEIGKPAEGALENGHALSNGSTKTDAQPGAKAPNVSELTAEAHVAELIQAYRELGLLLANIDPLTAAPTSHPLLELSRFELSTADL